MNDFDSPVADAIVVNRAASMVHGAWAVLVIVILAGTLGLTILVEMDTGARVFLWVNSAVLAGILIMVWIHLARSPARLEISPGSIVERRRRKEPLVIERGTGELVLDRKYYPGGYSHFLRRPDEEDGIDLARYDQREVKRAAESVGWRFVPVE